MAGSILPVSKPMSVREISLRAADFEFNPNIAVKYWLRTADMLLQEARIYEEEHNDQQAYLLLMRYAHLIAEKLPLHPQARDGENRQSMKRAQGKVLDAMDRLEVLKPKINARYNQWQDALERRRQASAAVEHERSQSRSRLDPAALDPAVAGNSTTLAAAENGELAVKLAHKEIRRRDAARKATRRAGVSEEEEQARRTAGVWDDWEANLSRNDFPNDQDDEIRRNVEAARRRLEGVHDIVPDGFRRSLAQQSRPTSIRPSQSLRNDSTEYRYPSIIKSQALTYDNNRYDSRSKSISPQRPYLPPKPPKERFEEPAYENVPPPVPEKPTADPESAVGEMKAPPSFTFRPAAYLESGQPLRTVWLPPSLRQRFLEIAAPNTRRNIETCGMLCGTLISNALFISKLVIPEQEGTSDTCETTNESAFFDYCDSEGLMTLGWIHTHPTQTCFMSSRDLHTHSAYQAMMPESIAIVCAPKKEPSWGVYRLTDPPGKQCVLSCRQPGLFHPHDVDNLYTDALRPGHVFEAAGLEFGVVDLRP